MIRRNVLNPYGLRSEQLLRRAEPIPGRPAPIDPKTGQAVRPALDEQATVASVFDARPINSGDFDFTVTGVGAPSLPMSLQVQVPAGYVAVVRAVSWEVTMSGGFFVWGYDVYGLDQSGALATLTSGGTPVDGFGGMSLGLSYDELPCYFIVDQNQYMGITFYPPVSDPIPTFGSGWARFHGNLLRKTGRWLQLEPGTLGGLGVSGAAPVHGVAQSPGPALAPSKPAPQTAPPPSGKRWFALSSGAFRPSVQTSAISTAPRGPLFNRGRKFWR